MADRPILFSGAMVKALLAGTKTQTRRIIKDAPTEPGWILYSAAGKKTWMGPNGYPSMPCTVRFATGDRLWVREAWRCNGWAPDVATIFYRASEGDGYTAMCEQWPVADHNPLRVETKWSPSLHLPRWASRLTLTVTDVRVQRLQDCSEADAIAEGIVKARDGYFMVPGVDHPNKHFGELSRVTAREMYAALWDVINGSGSWLASPWVVALTFSVERRNIDAARAA